MIVTNSSLLGTADARTRVFLNPARAGNHWLTVRLIGSSTNRAGIGARLTVTVGGRSQAAEILTSTSAFTGVQPEAHFGLGAATVVDRLDIAWPGGSTTSQTNVSVDQLLVVSQG